MNNDHIIIRYGLFISPDSLSQRIGDLTEEFCKAVNLDDCYIWELRDPHVFFFSFCDQGFTYKNTDRGIVSLTESPYRLATRAIKKRTALFMFYIDVLAKYTSNASGYFIDCIKTGATLIHEPTPVLLQSKKKKQVNSNQQRPRRLMKRKISEVVPSTPTVAKTSSSAGFSGKLKTSHARILNNMRQLKTKNRKQSRVI